ncbi:MAG: response regulator [Pseudomonadales bacterium]
MTTPRTKVGLIDDSKGSRRIVERLLTRNGYEVAVAEDGYLGMLMIRRDTPDVILLDIDMPAIDGLTLCRMLKANERYAKLPVVLLSSKNTEFDVADGAIAGADDYLTKPFTEDTVVKCLEKVLANGK